MIVPRKADHKYYLDHRGDRFYIMTNDIGINYRVVSAPVSDPRQKNWVEVVPYRKPVKIDSIDAFADFLVLRSRENGLANIEVVDLRDGRLNRVTFPEPVYALFGSTNEEFNTTKYRYNYQSLVTPGSVYDLSLIHI